MYYLQQAGDGVPDVDNRYGVFDASVATDSQSLLFGDVVRANFKAEGDTLGY
jgi:hypothetical protein